MTIYIFGSNGMLGGYMQKVMPQAIALTRKEFDIILDDESKLSFIHKDDIIINCAGVIPQRVPQTNTKTYIKVNTLFPHLLCSLCDNVIHITTDCVFSGDRGGYIETDEGCEKSLYGVSKYLGEPKKACVIRTSIIGHERYNKKSLLEWVLSQHGKIRGYSKVYWNGVTCLFLAKFIKDLIDTNKLWKGVRHLFGETISKYGMIQVINEVYELGLNVEKVEEPRSDKTLLTIYKTIPTPSFRDMVREQKEYFDLKSPGQI